VNAEVDRFRGRTAIVTGAARGVGLSIVQGLLRGGAQVVAADRRVDGLTSTLQNESQLLCVRADVARVEDCELIVRQAADRHGAIDMLFNNAGITIRAPVEETDDVLWQLIQDTNLRSAFACTRAAVPYLKAARGAVVNIASINAIRGNVDLTAYSASKGGVVALTRALATELAGEGIRVNALCPGTLDTEMTAEYLASLPDPGETRAMLMRKHPLGRLGTPNDVAAAALFLASDAASFITGVALPIDGGRHLL
jgi:NAD(P)-dependent dehydrogenase (short-subunit alcohol dehydrogenase family)